MSCKEEQNAKLDSERAGLCIVLKLRRAQAIRALCGEKMFVSFVLLGYRNRIIILSECVV